MNILITGAKGFVGKNLCAELKNIRDGKARTYKLSGDLNIMEFDKDSKPEELDEYCKQADFVFNLAGVNRPKTPKNSWKAISALHRHCSTR
jgi:UDP-2-acetamido-2,6-beta-L-arabino-hexul-4-ose reductase